LRKDYNYKVSNIKLDTSHKHTPQVQLTGAVSDFVRREDDNHTLLIVYYAGHGSPGKSPGQLKMMG